MARRSAEQAQVPCLAELALDEDGGGGTCRGRSAAMRVNLTINIRPYRQFVIVFARLLGDAAVQGLQQVGERREAEVPLVKGRVEPLDQRPDGRLERPRFTAAGRQHAHRLGHEVGRVLERGRLQGGGIQLHRGGRGASGGQVAVEAELIAGELVAARGAARSEADEKAAISAAPLRQRRVIAVGSDEDHDAKGEGAVADPRPRPG